MIESAIWRSLGKRALVGGAAYAGLLKAFLWLAFLATAVALIACNSDEDVGQVVSAVPAVDYETVALETIQVTDGQILYVPVYPEVYYGDGQRILTLDITLAIHNADLNHSIVVTSARYYDHEGNFVREYVPEALQLPPLAALTFAIASQDAIGDVGASFVVEWVADTSVADPVVEAVMIGPQNQQGLSFVSVARVISEIE